MHAAFQRLVARVQPLGNPARKYLRTAERQGERLVARLEAAGTLSHVHLDRAAPALTEDFERIAAAGRDPEEKLALLGTFYAVQFLHHNARALEQLAVDLAERSDRLGSWAIFLGRTEEEFSQLISTYIRHVLRVVLPPETDPFGIFNVGTRAHQDDIDVAVIDGGWKNRAELDRAIARLAGQLLRYASPLDNYLGGAVGADAFAIGVDELLRALQSGRLDYLVVTELLRAEPLAGHPSVVRRLREEVTSEYFFRPGRDNFRHELYLRGILGETRGLLLHPPPPDWVNPKDDALRLILGLATAFKTIEGVMATQPGDILTELIARRPRLRAPLSRLQESRIFLETFRQAAQLLVAQEEDIAVEGESARGNLAHVAAALGYRTWGPVQAVDHLLVHYYEAVEAARAAAVTLIDEVARHLTEISRFSGWARMAPPEDTATVLAWALAGDARAFRGVRFYDDLLQALATPDKALLQAFVRSFARLSPEERHELAKLYAEWGREAPYALLTILTLAAGVESGGPVDAAGEIADAFVPGLSQFPEAVRALSRVFRFYPGLVNRFLLTLDEAKLDRLDAEIEVPIGNPEVSAARDRFRALIQVHRRCSRYVKRVLARVTARYPATVEAISDDAALTTLARGRLAASERHPNAEEQKGLLGDFYDIAFLKIAMGTLRGDPDARTRAAFVELTTTYLDRLFDFCFRQADREAGGRVPQRDRIGVFLSGGNARGRPYDEDYDLLALIDSNASEDRQFAERVVILMNRQIARRGVIAQYRLADHLQHFVTTLDELVELLSRDDDDLFVDRCQLLGSRTVIGSRRIEEQLEARVLRPLIYSQARRFTTRVAIELAEHRRGFHPLPKGLLNLKESPGGLREIDLCLAIAKARLGVWRLPWADPFAELARLDPRLAAVYEGLGAAHDFLVAVRSAYRVAVATTHEIEKDHLDGAAQILGYTSDGGKVGLQLFADIEHRLVESAALIDEMARAAARA